MDYAGKPFIYRRSNKIGGPNYEKVVKRILEENPDLKQFLDSMGRPAATEFLQRVHGPFSLIAVQKELKGSDIEQKIERILPFMREVAEGEMNKYVDVGGVECSYPYLKLPMEPAAER